MKKSLRDALPFAEAFSKIFYPFAEVVVHDLEKDKIEAIYNPISRREVGDSSYLDRVDFDVKERVIGPYDKTNWDGRPLKSISVLICTPEGKPEGFVCVNVDVSHFQVLRTFLETAPMGEKEEKLFKEDLYEKINLFVRKYCREHQVSVEALSREEKKEIVLALVEEGAFKEKNAANYVARVLGISRATVYNYLK